MSKISAYGTLGAAQPGDELVVVDVDDLTMAATGTTKKITAGNLIPFVTIPASGDATGTTDVANINAALTAGQPVALIPGQTYTIATPILIQQQSFLTGFQANHASEDDFYGAGSGQPTGAIIQTPSNGDSFTGAALIYMADPGGTQMYGVDISGVSLISWAAAGITSSTHGISAIGAWGACVLRGVQVQKSGGDNLHMDVGGTGKVPDDWMVSGCKFSGARNGYGVNVANNLPDSWFVDCESSENNLDGWYFAWSDNTRLTTCKGENNGGAGFHLGGLSTNPRHFSLTACNAQINSQDGFLFDNSGGGAGGTYVLTGCVSRSDNQAASTYAGFRAHGCSSRIMASGCYAEGAAYGAYEGSTSYGMCFTGCYLAGTTAATHDDGSNTHALVNQSAVPF